VAVVVALMLGAGLRMAVLAVLAVAAKVSEAMVFQLPVS